jgi:hypothetical protein
MQAHCWLGLHRLEEGLLIAVFHNCSALNFQNDLEYFHSSSKSYIEQYQVYCQEKDR